MSELDLTTRLALEKLLLSSSNPKLSPDQLSLFELENLTFILDDFDGIEASEAIEVGVIGIDANNFGVIGDTGDTNPINKLTPVSVFHYLFYSGQAELFHYLVSTYHLSDLKSNQLTGPSLRERSLRSSGPPLILIVVRLYLDPERFAQFYHINHQVIFSQEHSHEFYWLFFQTLLKLGWYILPNQYRLVEICLEIALAKVNYSSISISTVEQTQNNLIRLYQELYQTGIQIGLRRFFKNYKLMYLVIQVMPKIYQYIREHYSATLIQAVYRGYRTRKMSGLHPDTSIVTIINVENVLN